MRKQSQLSSNYSCIDFYVYVSLSLLLSWWHREGHNYLCSIELVSNSKPWWNIKQKLLLLLQKVLLTLEISLEEQCKNTRIHRKKGYKKIFKNPAHHSGVPSLYLPECHQICHIMRTGQCGSPVECGAEWSPHTGPGLLVNAKTRMMRVCVGVPFPCWKLNAWEEGVTVQHNPGNTLCQTEGDKKTSTFVCILNFYITCMYLCIVTTP